jgi:hypothetical protein
MPATTIEHHPEWLPLETEREQAIRLAREALKQAERHRDECDLALRELTGDGPLYAAILKARLAGDEAAESAAEIEFYADLFVRSGVMAPAWVDADRLTEAVARLRLEREH